MSIFRFPSYLVAENVVNVFIGSFPRRRYDIVLEGNLIYCRSRTARILRGVLNSLFNGDKKMYEEE